VVYLIPIMAAGLFSKTGDGVRIFIISLGCYGLLGLLQSQDWITPIVPLDTTGRSIVALLAFATAGGMLAYIAMLWSGSTEHFVAQSGEQSEALYHSNQKLLEKNIQQIELGSELSTAAAQLLAASHQQASGATEQASAVSEVSTTIEELGSTARQIAIAAEQVAEASGQTLENLSEGQDAVDNSIQAMERIRGRVQDVSTRVLNLGERSQQIGEIIDLINDLSDETHLLALNAAIEAAGAGEHGRRFAVVAAEVKSLANRALAAAKEVKGVIAEIQQATNAAVLAAEEGGKEVERGVVLAHSAGQVMNNIVMVAERTAQSSAEISLATAQQQSASEQVVETMREIADVARQTAAGSRQMAESAQMLTAIAERLHGIVYESPRETSARSAMDEIDERMYSLAKNGRG
jgi:methyl-accepting chemotaxis protein